MPFEFWVRRPELFLMLSFIFFDSQGFSSKSCHVTCVTHSFCLLHSQTVLSPQPLLLTHLHCQFIGSSYLLSCLSMRLKDCNLFLSCRTKAFLILGSRSLPNVLSKSDAFLGPCSSRPFSFTCAVTRWWSRFTSVLFLSGRPLPVECLYNGCSQESLLFPHRRRLYLYRCCHW